jgi:hypothetical protein
MAQQQRQSTGEQALTNLSPGNGRKIYFLNKDTLKTFIGGFLQSSLKTRIN